ncbi:MAG: M3 family oligoendopeptidase [Lachnospiraceae bacterium]|nr:M3 family oligoendopeptidase [Lachnospiraceae bacterium]
MKTEWNLDVIYQGLDDPAYEEDIAGLTQTIERLGDFLRKYEERQAGKTVKEPERETVEALLTLMEEMEDLGEKLMQYVGLRQQADTQNGELMAQINRLQRILADATPHTTAAKKILAAVSDVDAMAGESELVKEYAFLLKENKEEAKHMLEDAVESMISAMNMTGGEAWSSLRDYLTSTLRVEYRGEEITLSEVRNLAYSPDRKVRRDAYEAEVKAYEKIQDSVAFAINNIKNQVIMLADKRGYDSVLGMTLIQSRMNRETLDAMMEAIREYLPVFRKYLRKKAQLLGYEKGLPWYELFAPMGKADTKYTVEEAGEYLVRCFGEFSSDMAGLMQEAFDNQWIDFYPKKGKAGGAFCSGVYRRKESRILTNFDGYFGSVGTLAHELGHAYHNRQLEGERILNQGYSMPVAETASTFNEIHLGEYALRGAKGEERLNLLQNDLQDQTQVIMDIYSRYLFESNVFERCRSSFLMAKDLNAMMLEAQKEAYGDGLDQDCLNPGMWICKSHYYRTGLSFYNFPYAFGNLFALGLYAMFKEEGEAFVAKYRKMLRATSTCSVEDAGRMMGIDFGKKEFWKAGLEEIASRVELFVTEF